MSSSVERAAALFGEGFSCSQAVLAAMGPSRGLDSELALRLGGAFGAGMARSGETCGAVTGALMAIGLEHGRVAADDRQAKGRCYDIGGEFLARFRAAEGTTSCRDLLGYDLSIPSEACQVRQAGLFVSLCPRLVSVAVEIAERLLVEQPRSDALVSEDNDL